MLLLRRAAIAGLFCGLLLGACGSGGQAAVEDEGDVDRAVSASQPETTAETGDRSSEFCIAAAALEGERPEAYVGSPQHIDDITDLAGLAPEAIQEQANTYRVFLDNDGVDPADPESNLIVNWPDDVQAAVADLTDFISANC